MADQRRTTAGLVHAAGRFDVHCGSDFTAFAVPTIVSEIRRHGRAPAPSEIAAHLEIGRDEVLKGLEVGHAVTASAEPTRAI